MNRSAPHTTHPGKAGAISTPQITSKADRYDPEHILPIKANALAGVRMSHPIHAAGLQGGNPARLQDEVVPPSQPMADGSATTATALALLLLLHILLAGSIKSEVKCKTLKSKTKNKE